MIRILLLAIFYIIFLNNGFTQNRSELEKKRQQSLEEINLANKILNETRLNKKQTIHKLNVINKKIDARNRVISVINTELKSLSERIEERQQIIEILNNDLETIKNQYAQLIYYSYRSIKNNDLIMFILSSSDFIQAYRRIKYFQQYGEYRRKQAAIIIELTAIIEKETQILQNIILVKKSLLNENEKEKQNLIQEINEGKELVKSLKNKESVILKEIKEKKRIADNLTAEIQRIIEEEARKALQNKGEKTVIEDKALTVIFQKNKGNLPWPVSSKGIIVGDFGKHVHPVLKNVYVENNGIDIGTIRNSEARVIFDGTVSKVLAIKGANYTVIVRHGNYLTIYQNLVNVKVKPGQRVYNQDVLGDIFYDDNSNSTILHFELWNELTKLNPREWIINMK